MFADQNKKILEESECLNLNADEDNNCSNNDDFVDHETLEYQRQRTTPVFSLSNIDGQNEEVLIAPVESFGQLADSKVLGLVSS